MKLIPMPKTIDNKRTFKQQLHLTLYFGTSHKTANITYIYLQFIRRLVLRYKTNMKPLMINGSDRFVHKKYVQ